MITADVSAQTLDNKPVTGQGSLKLYQVSYDAAGKPTEKAVEEWALATDDQGHAQQQIKAAQAGQYRLSYTVKDKSNHEIEGGYVFVIRDDKFTGQQFRFDDIEIVTDKRENTRPAKRSSS